MGRRGRILRRDRGQVVSQPLRPFDTLHWAQEQRTGSVARKAVLMALAGFADERGSCYPGQATLADITEQSERTVRSHLAALEEDGFIRRERRANTSGSGGRSSDRYYLGVLPANIAGKSEGGSPATGADLPANGQGLTGNSEGGNRQPVAGEVPEKGQYPVEMPANGHSLFGDASPQDARGPTFDDFMAAYPRKKEPGKARRAWRAACKKESPSVIVAAARQYAREKEGSKYIKYPASWLNGECWADEPDPPAANGNGAPDPTWAMNNPHLVGDQ